jgi:hypothetical protein
MGGSNSYSEYKERERGCEGEERKREKESA